MTARNGDHVKEMAAANDAIVQPWLDYWMKLFEQNSQWTQMLMAGMPPTMDFNQARQQWLKTMSTSLDGYLRSPAFLDAMRRTADMSTATKTNTDAMKLEVTRQIGIPHSEDIRGLFERLESAHELVMERLAAIEVRLSSMESKLTTKTKDTGGRQK
ncbi:MAG: hypothetical protein KDA92_19735 [Planctomycetales bacterium]|nr:hypothetical protein [Planctomycetales bacterium]MCA9171645.1 hypothetical protein [Planctomycetales bacterium]